MTFRAQFWYVFGLAALILIVLRLPITLQTIRSRRRFSDPVVVTFSLGLLLGAFGTLSKQPLIANQIDAVLGVNASWLIADGLFLIGLCLGTFWVDLMRFPTTKQFGRQLFAQPRTLILAAVLGWMMLGAWLTAPVWQSLERGGIDVNGNSLILTTRIAYFGYAIFALCYISYHFYQKRKVMADRFQYIRLTIPWAGITLAITAPVMQLLGLVEIYWQPALASVVWPALWGVVTVIQGLVAILIITTFAPPAYRLISWLDKQYLVYRLRRVHTAAVKARPDLLFTPIQAGLITRQPDALLVRLVNDLADINYLLGGTQEIATPAGGLMPAQARNLLHENRQAWMQGLNAQQTATTAPRPTGETYALARWYAQLA